MEYFGYLAAVFIGIALGLIGGGGSILTIPILVYLFKIDAALATSYSLFIVGITATIGSMAHYKMGNLRIKSALYFAFPSLISLLFVRKIILPIIPELLFKINELQVTKNMLILLIFALLMMAASVAMIKKSVDRPSAVKTNYGRLAFIGLSVGVIIGLMGAGGGFLIIPALIFFAGLTIKEAVGTSLLIISINSLIGFAGDVVNDVVINYELLFRITVLAIIGMFVGAFLSKKVNAEKLKPAFGYFILVMGIYIIVKEIFLNNL